MCGKLLLYIRIYKCTQLSNIRLSAVCKTHLHSICNQVIVRKPTYTILFLYHLIQTWYRSRRRQASAHFSVYRWPLRIWALVLRSTTSAQQGKASSYCSADQPLEPHVLRLLTEWSVSWVHRKLLFHATLNLIMFVMTATFHTAT